MAQEFSRNIRIVASDPQPTDHDVELSATVLDGEATVDHPARLAVTLVNSGGTTREFSTVFDGGASSSHGTPGIRLLCGDGEWPPKCVTTEGSGKTRDALESAELARPAHLSGGESAREVFSVTDDPTVPGCIPPGTYRYETLYAIDVVKLFRQNHDTETAPTFRWGFELEIS